ncbi:MlaD family protein [Patulibacter sp. SYSU D01012]|uniref:MlaD family protein n=1 Tax=Patulibacter sp. SYSU D01012 TaxID=2817381 RepID=UPI001B30CE93|nr:MlaD family protein [Patulibacter sp. SYSU D01012]
MSPRRSRPVRHRTFQQTVRSNVRWGLATILLAVLAAYLAFGGPLPWGGPRQIHVLTRDAGALRAGAATKVRVAGVDVGNVSRIEPLKGKPGVTDITVDLEDDAPAIRQDATVKIRPRLFLEGNFFLDVNPGTPGAKVLADGGAIPPGATTRHVASDEVFSAFDAQTRKNFQGTLKALGQGLDDGGAESLNTLLRVTPPALADVTTVAAAVRGQQDGDLRRLVRETGGVLANLQAHENGLRGTISQGRAVFDTFAAAQLDLRATMRQVDATTRDLMPQLTRIIDGIPEARALVRDARPLVRRLPATLDLANPALNALLVFARSQDVQGLTAELRPTLATLSRITEPLGQVADELRPVGKCLTDNILPVLNGVVPDGKLTTNLKVYEELMDEFAGLGATTANFDSNGPWTRYLLGLGNQLISTNDGGQALEGRADRPITGSTPTPTTTPPLRPDVPCETQSVPSLETTMQPFAGRQRTDTADRGALSELTSTALQGLKSVDQGDTTVRALQQRLTTLLGPAGATDAAPAPAAEARRDDPAKARKARDRRDGDERPKAKKAPARRPSPPKTPAAKTPAARKPAPTTKRDPRKPYVSEREAAQQAGGIGEQPEETP